MRICESPRSKGRENLEEAQLMSDSLNQKTEFDSMCHRLRGVKLILGSKAQWLFSF